MTVHRHHAIALEVFVGQGVVFERALLKAGAGIITVPPK